MMKNNHKKITCLGLLASVALPGVASALSALPDDEMSGVAGQSGLTFRVTEPAAGITLGSLNILAQNPNPATIDEVGELGVRMAGPTGGMAFLKRIDTSRSLIDISLDAGATGVSTADTGVYLDMDWARSRMEFESVRLSTLPGTSFGRYAFDSSGRLEVKTVSGLLYAGNPTYGASAKLNFNAVNPALWAIGEMGAATPGSLYWRNNGAELTLNDFSFYFHMPDGRIGVNANGLLLESKPGTKVAFSLTIDFMYDSLGASAFSVSAADRSMLYWGWRGNWTDLQLTAKSGGRVDGNGNGLNASIRFNYDPDFVWVVGEGGTAPARLEFGNWTTIPGNPYAFNIPYIGIEPVKTGTTQGTYGLCWGTAAVTATANGACSGLGTGPVASNLAAQQIAVRSASDQDAMALTVRDMRLAAYSSTVDIIDRTVNPLNPAQRFDWGLIYTFADLDADIFVSPRADGTMAFRLGLTTQTLGTTSADRWTFGTNFMIADTLTDYAIGLMGADVLMALANGRMAMTSNGIVTESTNLRYQIRGMLGGGQLPAMTVPQFMAYVDLNLESDRYVFTLTPSPAGNTALHYSGFINLANLGTSLANPVPGSGNHMHDDGTYLSLAEPNLSKLDVDFRFANITGPLRFRNGRVDLQGASQSTLRLLISNDIDVGKTAVLACAVGVYSCPDVLATTPLQVGSLEFGGKNLATIVMPSGTIRSQITFQPQVP